MTIPAQPATMRRAGLDRLIRLRRWVSLFLLGLTVVSFSACIYVPGHRGWYDRHDRRDDRNDHRDDRNDRRDDRNDRR